MEIELWQIALTVIGSVFALQLLIAAVLMLEAKLRRYRVPPEGFPYFHPPPVTVANTEVQIYSAGRQIFDAMLAAIEAARELIYLETYIWKGDELGERFKQALIRKAGEGVAVYLIYDTFANLVVPQAFFRFPLRSTCCPTGPGAAPGTPSTSAATGATTARSW